MRREETTESVVKILILSGGLRSPLDRIAFAVRTDSVRRTMTKHELLGD
ncbi:hypothetical protein HMPREF0673_00992 [Leyella stercorea DSM 18206]|uniref:Uncharacterized protein n=1 Tax=Leyella stercorea DSM 18206 TaxID=1002367 RepID=G6AWJ4_9BACT|nr:hypothetical protein HMPREF0673_00992 [Leyella stercorea DSM 18206]